MIGGVFGYLAIEFMIIGLKISKSGMAMFAEQLGVLVPITFDVIFMGFPLFKTNLLGMTLIVSMLSYQAYLTSRKNKDD